ncbi:uncharacterized protein LOC127123752 [Lathyrus oleraceus]|uniref:uncharacterized protein LOC127123752 n=1 Tax=Pisum sativum TaxID=3888 RepID=UPI0021CF896A|nr:uncharacterized protein LOC127123752 [Pisum sativum]
MEAILELLQTQRTSTSANPADVNVTHAAGVTNPTTVVGVTVETPVEILNVHVQVIAPETSRPASQVALPAVDSARPADYQLLDDIIRVIEGFSAFGIDARDFCLVPNVVLPQKFKVPDLPKYKDSLSGASLDWYMSLKRTKIRSWRDLYEAFLKQYKYNLDMAPTRLQLHNQAQRSNETFKEYAQCWPEMASRVRPTLSDNELVDIFMENGLKSGKITYTTALQTTNKRSHGGFAKKKEGKTNVVTASVYPQYQFPMAPMPYYPYSYVAATQYQQPPWAIVPKELPATSPPFHRNHNPNASCTFHAGYIGYSIEDCWTLKKRIQELIDQEVLSFSEEKPNVKMNPLPNHGGSTVNAVIKEETSEIVLRADDVKTPLSVVLKRLE